MTPKILTSKKTAVLLKNENTMSRRYLRILEKWIPTGTRYFEGWPDRPNCGHFLGGVHWYGIETIAGAMACAAAASSPDYDPRVGGCSKKELKEMALKALRYLCFTHDSGPKDCVRPKTGMGRPEICGTKWGETGQGFFRESQCGTTVSGMAVVALLLGRMVDDETWRLLANVHKDYAARFGTMAPKSGVYTNTQMEENGWTSCGLASVELVLKHTPKNPTWSSTARRWMFSTATTQQDTKNHGWIDDEHTVRQLTGQIFTTLPDYMAENHGMVHPSYTASAVHFMGYLGVIYGIFGEEVPPHALFNRKPIYDQLKLTTDRTGSMHPVQGMDWPYLFTDPGTGTHGAAAIMLGDRDAAALERMALKTLEDRQDSNDGRMIDEEVASKAHGPQDPISIRECIIAGPAYSYLMHRILGNGPKPVSDSELERNLRGVKSYPHSGFVFHRHRTGQTSFSWRNCIMALPLNKDGIQTVAPAADSFFATFSIRNKPDSHEEVSIHVDEQKDGFSAALLIDRAQASVRQEILFAGLPNGISLSSERLTAAENLTVEHVEQGFLRIVNENFKTMKGNCNGYRVLHTPDGSERFKGFVSTDPESDLIRTLDHPGWVNVDNRMGLVYSGPGKTVYHNRHFFNPWRAVADDLTLSRIERPFRVKKGGEIARLNALIAPDRSAAKTAELSPGLLKGPSHAVAFLTQGYLAAANFSDRRRTLSFVSPRSVKDAIPVFAGQCELSSGKVTYSLELGAGKSTLRQELLSIVAKGSLRITATETGSVLAENTGRGKAVVSTPQESHPIRPGQIVKIA
jgi:hypothetical protein